MPRKSCKKCNRFFSSQRETNQFCSVSCSVVYRKQNPSKEELELAQKGIEQRRKYNLNSRLKKKMQDYHQNYQNGIFTGRQKGQVAPLLSYLPRHTINLLGKLKFRTLDDMVQSPEDLAVLADPEGVMLGNYDF